MVSYVVAASVFILSTSVMVNFVVEPPGNPGKGLVEQDLKSKASTVLDVLMGTPGYPADWEQTDADAVARLGLVREGSSARLDPTKYAAVARGRFVSPSDTNGFVDYQEAKEALGLDGYDFHLRGRPLLPDDLEGFYGTKGLGAYRIAYIGDWTGPGLPTEASKKEQYALDRLDVGFVNLTRLSLTDIGDVYRDDVGVLKSNLVPLLGTSVSQVAITAGSGNAYDFHRVNATDFDHLLLPSVLPGSAKSLALSKADNAGEYELGYTKGREIRAILGSVNLTGQTSATLAWKEYVSTLRDAGDYGFIEVSPDAGASWFPVTNDASQRSQDTTTSPQPAGLWRDRVATLSAANCVACMGNEDVLLATHWVADGDNDRGDGWILDAVTITAGGATLVTKDFETPEYHLLVIGSNVSQTALTAAEVKYAIRDYVQTYGGRILVLGGDTNVQWLQPLFHVAITYASQGVSNPDPTHALLTTPNELDWRGTDYNNNGRAWKFSSSVDDDLFDMVIGTGEDEHILSVSTTGAFGATEGGIILTTYLPHEMELEERLRFLANAITYGHYHHLYMEMGPEVPGDVPVGSVSRTAIMEKTRDTDAEFTEMSFVLYLWRGNTTASDAAIAAPSAPQGFTVTPGAGTVQLGWAQPASVGTGTHMGYHVYRSTAPGAGALLASVGTSTTTYTDNDVTNGVTYYYNVTAWSSKGQTSTPVLSATPATIPGKPESLSVAGAASQIALTWTDPLSNGGAAITGYKIHRSATNNFAPSDANLLAEVGANNSFVDMAPLGSGTAYYRLRAVNGMGVGPSSSEVGGAPLAVPSAPPSVAATPNVNSIDVTWAPPSSLTTITTYQVYAGTSASTTSWLANVSGTLTTYTESGLASGVTRYYRVLAVNEDGAGSLSTAASATTLTLSTAPTLVTATGGADSITLAWAPPTDPGSSSPTMYRIWRGTSADTLVELADTESGSNSSFVDALLPDAATRYYQVAAVTAAEGTRSAVVSARTHDVASAPVLTLTPGVERMTLTWTVPADAGGVGATITAYKIYRGETAGSEVLVYTVPVTDGTLAQDPLLAPNKTYWYYVLAVTAAGDGAASDEKSATTLSQPAVVVPGV